MLTKESKKLQVEEKSINKGMEECLRIDSFISIRRTSFLFLEFCEQVCSNKHAVKLSAEIIVLEKHRENERSKDRENITRFL